MTLKAHFDGKVIVPDEPVDLPRNQQLVIHVQPIQPQQPAQSSSLDWLLENSVDDPALPPDLCVNLDHYLYGVPKRQP